MPDTGSPQTDELESTVLDSTTLPVLGGPQPAITGRQLDPADVVAANYEAVYRYGFRLCGNQSVAEDITQETFLQALKHLDQLRSSQAQRGWLLSIARRVYLRSVSKVQHRASQSLDVANAEMEQCLAQSPGQVQQVENHDAVQTALCQLGQDARLVVVMYYFEELSYSEIAQQLDIPIGTVMSRLNRSREALRRALDAPAAPHVQSSRVQTRAQAQEGLNRG